MSLVFLTNISFCLFRSHKSKEWKKQQTFKGSGNLDYRTVVVRGMSGRGYPTIVGYSDFMVNYQPALQDSMHSKMRATPYMATVSHMHRSIQRPALVSMGYPTARPIKSYQTSRG